MKTITQYVKQATLALFLILGLAQSAHASLIQQDLILVFDDGSEFNLGFIEFRIDIEDLNTGFVSTFDSSFRLQEMNIFGNTDFEFFDFEAIIDSDNLFAGVNFLVFDVDEIGFADNWSYNVIFDTFNPAGFFTDGFIDIFNEDEMLVGFFDFTLGEANVVSAPSAILVLLLCTPLLFGRRLKS